MILMFYQMHALGSYSVLAEMVHCHLNHWVAEQKVQEKQ